MRKGRNTADIRIRVSSVLKLELERQAKAMGTTKSDLARCWLAEKLRLPEGYYLLAEELGYRKVRKR